MAIDAIDTTANPPPIYASQYRPLGPSYSLPFMGREKGKGIVEGHGSGGTTVEVVRQVAGSGSGGGESGGRWAGASKQLTVIAAIWVVDGSSTLSRSSSSPSRSTHKHHRKLFYRPEGGHRTTKGDIETHLAAPR